jgi:hypothetical protein
MIIAKRNCPLAFASDPERPAISGRPESESKWLPDMDWMTFGKRLPIRSRYPSAGPGAGAKGAPDLTGRRVAGQAVPDITGRNSTAGNESSGVAPGHVKESIARIERMIDARSWKKISDVRPDSFVRFRSSLICSAKTKKEYQPSINAFLNWCVRTDRLLLNPLAKVDRVDIPGKSVRPTRAFPSQELLRLFCATAHALFIRHPSTPDSGEPKLLRSSGQTSTRFPTFQVRFFVMAQ